MVSHWIDETVFGEERGLEQIVYYHVHEDVSKHDCDISVPEDLWSGEVGQFRPQMKIECLSCGSVLLSEEDTHFRFD